MNSLNAPLQQGPATPGPVDHGEIEKARIISYHRPDETRENIYSAARGLPAQVNLLPIDLGALVGGGPRFMYLWAPGLAD